MCFIMYYISIIFLTFLLFALVSTTICSVRNEQPHHGRIIVIPTHGGGGHGGKEAHRSKQHHQHLLSPGAPMAPRPDMPAEAAMRAGDGPSISSWVKPGCMMELARLAKIPQPESGLVCPRCRSAETKFCYYNNYSLSQPRHFCRACRRYWTHGGALRDLPFSSTVRWRRHRNKPASNKHEPSKVASCCASGTGGRASPSSSSGTSAVPGVGGRVPAAAATAVMHTRPLEQLASLAVAVGTERHTTVASTLSSLQGPPPVGYRHQLGNITAGVATTIRQEHQRYLPQRQPFSFLGYGDAVTAPTSAVGPLGASDAGGGGGTEAGGFARGQMQAAAISRVPEMMAANPPIPSTEIMTGTLMTTTSSPGEFQVESGLSHFLGLSGSWACSYGSCSAGNDGSGGSTSCTAAPGNSVWPDPSGLTSSSSGTML
ncbi:hypothetical protein C2845_PM01G18040 [Panicum miliaceum]|uniref:Dof zinc finger protein n=1 Tax=Panicum miliaceum TaxID=4540 RepID=A0A3L6THL9_PANMI|nr:hypothetical protein C2845_PM01G18040 [Panicum miliaceum]